MKDIINRVLYDLKDSQMNLSSSAARETIASLITSALQSNSIEIPKSQYDRMVKEERDDKWDEMIRVLTIQERDNERRSTE
mgnify:CR=1 FL=1